MAIINYASNERDLLARLMRAEAVGEGDLGMLMVATSSSIEPLLTA